MTQGCKSKQIGCSILFALDFISDISPDCPKLILFRKQMNNRSYIPIYKPNTAERDSSFGHYEKLSYDRIIMRLNQENQYLAKNMKELIIENRELKNKLYGQKAPIARPEYEVEEPRLYQPRADWKAGLRRYERKSGRVDRSQDGGEKEKEESQFQRQNSPGESEFKKPTIIEELSQSHFQAKAQIKRNAKGINLMPKDSDKMTKSQYNRKREDVQDMSKTVHESSKKNEKEDINEDKAPMLPETPISKANPENETSPKTQKPKKNNSPYLKVFGSNGKTLGFESSSKKYDNQVYLTNK